MAPTVVMPEYGITGIPEGMKDNVRADFKTGEFEKIIEVKGYRLAWKRASMCPCAGANDQTQQVDPNCTLCNGKGWLYFGPPGYILDTGKVGQLTDVQRTATGDGAIIKGVMTGLGTNLKAFTEVGQWLAGTSMVTVRPENRLGYYDKLIGLDSELVYSEVLTADGGLTLTARYPIVSVNYLRSLSQRFTTTDFTLSQGNLVWMTGRNPAKGTRLALHYQTFPVWLVTEHPHTVRDTLIKRKTKTPILPLGNPKALPIQAVVRYDFLLS